MKRKIYRYILRKIIQDETLHLTGKEKNMLTNLIKCKCQDNWKGNQNWWVRNMQ